MFGENIVVVSLDFPVEVMQIIERSAILKGKSVESFVIDACMAKAEEVLDAANIDGGEYP